MINQATLLLVLHDVGLVNRLQWPKPHGNGRKLPVIRHEPGVGVGGQAIAIDFTPEVFELRLVNVPF